MAEHYRADPEKGCAIMLLSGAALLVAGAILALMIFGFDPLVAVAIVIVGALAVYWLLRTFGRR